MNYDLEKYMEGIIQNLIRLVNNKRGVLYLAFVSGGILYILGLFSTSAFLENIIVAVSCGLFFSWYMISVKKRGMVKTTEKIIELTFRFIAKISIIVLFPLKKTLFLIDLHIIKPLKKLFFIIIPDKLPEILRPLYRFLWYAGTAAIAYWFIWLLFNENSKPSELGSINIGGKTYKFVITGVLYAGVILGFGLIDLIPSYLGIFFNWLSNFKWDIKFVIRW